MLYDLRGMRPIPTSKDFE